MNEEERKRMEYWQRKQAEENARAFWRSINEPLMPLVTTILVLGAIWLVVANVWIYRAEIISWIGHNWLPEVMVGIIVLGIVAGCTSRV